MNPRRLKKIINFRGVVEAMPCADGLAALGELSAVAWRLAVMLSRRADRRGDHGKAVASLGAMAAAGALRWPGADGLDAPASISRPSLGPVRAAAREEARS
jgi:hypothetical protein